MATWDLETGCERPIIGKGRIVGIGVGSGNLKPADLIKAAEKMGARIEENGNTYKIFPPDATQRPVFVKQNLGNGRDLANTIAQLRRAGLDIVPKENSVQQPLVSPTQVAQLRGKATTPVQAVPAPVEPPESPDAVEQLLEMLAEAEKRITVLAELMDLQGARIDALSTQNFEAEPALGRRVLALEKHLGLDVDPHAELDGKILAFLTETPVKLSGSVVASNIEEAPQAVGKRLQALASAKKVEVFQAVNGGSKLYKYKT